MRRVMLQNDKHEGGQGHDPEQRITMEGPRGKVRGPVSGVDKTYGDKKPRPDVFDEINCAKPGFPVMGK
jgi:hypothetical protein